MACRYHTDGQLLIERTRNSIATKLACNPSVRQQDMDAVRVRTIRPVTERARCRSFGSLSVRHNPGLATVLRPQIDARGLSRPARRCCCAHWMAAVGFGSAAQGDS